MSDESPNKTKLIVKRISSIAGQPDLAPILSEKLRPTDLQSLLLHVYEARVAKVTCGDIWCLGRKHQLVQSCDLDQRKLVEFDHLVYSTVEKSFEAVEFSPLCPLGLNAVIASTNQKKIISTIRNTEVLSDLGTALALEASNRRASEKAKSMASNTIRLCSSHRAIRAQKYEKSLGFTPHFRIFGMLSSGRNISYEHQFSIDALYEHISQYLRIFHAANNNGFGIEHLKISVSDMSITEAMIRWHEMDRERVSKNTLNGYGRLFDVDAPFCMMISDPEELPPEMIERYAASQEIKRLKLIKDSVLQRLSLEFPGIAYSFWLDRTGGIGHYDGVCFKIDGVNKDGVSYPLVDGGMTNWTGKLLSNAKELCFVSGIGTELFCRHYLL